VLCRDTTIVNVSLPHIQGSMSASQDEISWVLTSYIVSAAIAMPLVGWLADRLGVKYLFLASVIGFTFASALCGAATSLTQLVLYPLLQGVCSAGLVPLGQATLYAVYPRERHGYATWPPRPMWSSWAAWRSQRSATTVPAVRVAAAGGAPRRGRQCPRHRRPGVIHSADVRAARVYDAAAPAGDQQAEAGNLNPQRAGDHHQHCPPERRHHIAPRTPRAVNADNEIELRERGNAG
jgi:hypothetical protein